ncbi:MAG: hypothetical protein HZA77_14485 [Candidatus Schekmanbacteria bacterium]|nr:hypothetical protein [Candidatus Schekmanbacteria bacterium]
MKNKKLKAVLIICCVALAIAAAINTVSAQQLGITYLYNLSDFNGTIPFYGGRLSVDYERNELYVIYGNSVRVFNDKGMEIYSFGDDSDIGQLIDLAIDNEGKILLLTYKDKEFSILSCNYRGTPEEPIEIKNLPAEFSAFSPNRMVYGGGNLYLLSQSGLMIVVTDRKGNFKKAYDLARALEIKEEEKKDKQVDGFNVDKKGNIFFTIPVLFSVYEFSHDGNISSFGRVGSASGNFGVVSGIAKSDNGDFYVVDKLKNAVMVFDKNYNYLTEFGGRGLKPGNLTGPSDIIIDGMNRVYVTQQRGRGVSVFNLSFN